jgi:hypothetical protein
MGRHRHAEAFGDRGEAVAPPAVAQDERDRHDVWPLSPRHTIEIPHEVREEIVGMEFVHECGHECARPREPCCACGKQSHRTRAKPVAPPRRIELLFRSHGIFQLTVDVVYEVTELAHGCTSTKDGTPTRRAPIVRGPGRPRG